MSDAIDIVDFNIVDQSTGELRPSKNLAAVMAKGKVPFTPGVHFGLDDDLYHAVPALSNTGIKHLLVSPMDFWARSWMAPPLAEAPEESEARKIGKAYDKRIVDGRDPFYRGYFAELDSADYPKALRTMDDLRGAVTKLGEKPKGTSKAQIVAQLLGLSPDAQIWDQLVSEHAQAHAGRIPLDADLIRRIEVAAAMIEKHPELCKAFTGGMPQVSVFWVDRETGVPMKSRMDYLKPRAVVDLKTLANRNEMSIDRAIYQEMARRKYFIQAATYMEAADQIPALVQAGQVYGDVPKGFLEAVCAAKARQFLFVFQIKGIAPVARGMVLPKTLIFGCGQTIMRDAIRRFIECVETFGTDAWIDPSPIGSFDDAMFPVWATEV